MKRRSHAWICALVLVALSQSSLCRGNTVSDTRRTRREISVTGASRPKGEETGNAEQMSLERKEKEDDGPEEDDAARDKGKGRRAASDPAGPDGDFRSSNAAEATRARDDAGVEEPEEADDEEATAAAAERDAGGEEPGEDPVRSPRDTSGGDLDRYTEPNGRSSLYDDYEAKDVAKRGALGGPEDYEEIENGPAVLLPREDTAAVRGSPAGVAGKTDARVKRDRGEITEIDTSKSSPDQDPAKLREPRKTPYPRQVSRIASPKSSNEEIAPEIKGVGGSESAISKLDDPTGIRGQTGAATSSRRGDELDAEYERRVEEEIQRRIDSLKEEIQRDVQAQQRMRDIEDNNARFDELRDSEHEDRGRESFEGDPIEKRQAKRSVREIADADPSSQTGEKGRCHGRREQRDKRLPRSDENERSDVSKANESLKGQFVANHDSLPEQLPSKALRKKRERVRQIFLVNNDQHQAKKRGSRSYTLPSGRTAVRPESELSINCPNSNSYPHTNNRMLQVSLPVSVEDKNNEGERQNTAEHSDSLVSLTGSSQELSPYLEKEYKEAFGGLQSEPGSALARFKRIKRC